MPDRPETTFVFMGIEYRIPSPFPIPGDNHPGGAPDHAGGACRRARRVEVPGPTMPDTTADSRKDPTEGLRGEEIWDAFSVNDVVGIDGDEYRVLHVLPDGLFARHERFVSHTQLLSLEDIRIARDLGLLSVRRGADGTERSVGSSLPALPGEKAAESMKNRSPSRRRSRR